MKALTETDFWRRVRKTDGCWYWEGPKLPRGYGVFGRRGGKSDVGASGYAHRYSYVLHNGPIDGKMSVCHTCDNPSCVNPSHLFLGTQKDNVSDMIRKGRDNCAKGEQHGFARLTSDDVNDMRSYYRQGCMQRDIAAFFSVDRSHVSRIVNKQNWRHV